MSTHKEEYTREVFDITDELKLEILTGTPHEGKRIVTAKLVGVGSRNTYFGTRVSDVVEIRIPSSTDNDDLNALDALLAGLRELRQRQIRGLENAE